MNKLKMETSKIINREDWIQDQQVSHKSDDKNWDLVIEPKNALLDLKLRDLWAYRDLLWLFVRRDFVAQYKQTVLGPLWHLIQPIFTTIMFLFVFGKIADIPTDEIEPILFYMCGITVWSYFSSCLISTSNTFVSNAGIFGKVYFPRLILPLSIVLSNLVKLGIQIILLAAMMAWFAIKDGSVSISPYILLLPVLVLIMAIIGLGIGIIISSLTTKYRDFTVLIGFAVQLAMYATPIAYPMSYLKKSHYYWIINLNPMSSIVEAFRFSIFGKGTLDINGLIYSFSFAIVVLVIGAIVFNKVEKSFMDTV
jgi:lipopolysaccharide transport system permease protein